MALFLSPALSTGPLQFLIGTIYLQRNRNPTVNFAIDVINVIF